MALKPNKYLDYINELYEAGKFIPIVDRCYKLSELPEAMRRYERAEQQGKIVITMD